jgi:sugar lactone lactonase YvrE
MKHYIFRLLSRHLVLFAMMAGIAAGQDAKMGRSGPAKQVKDKGFLIEEAGFSTPESMLYDRDADLYLVANINGSAMARDGNGFISKVSPEGKVIKLKWIDGKAKDVTLNGPKGMALAGKSLYVTDIDCVRFFDRVSGAPKGEIVIKGARFLNDIAAGPDGSLHVTDSMGQAIFHIDAKHRVREVARGKPLMRPNGIQVDKGEIYVAGFGGDTVYRLGEEGKPAGKHKVPAGGLDGLIRLDDGTMFVSSWAGSAIYMIDPSGKVTTVFKGIPAPADIGFDTKRGRILIPHFNDDRVEARPCNGKNRRP